MKTKAVWILCLLLFGALSPLSLRQVLAEDVISLTSYQGYGAGSMIRNEYNWRKAAVFFSIPSAVALPQYSPDKLITLALPLETILNLSNDFTDDELQEIIQYDRYKKSFINNGNTLDKLKMPAFSIESDSANEITELLFRCEDYHVAMQNPFNDTELYLYNISYIKFPGVPFIPVPLPLK